MSPLHYKLAYFNARGIVEPARQLFHLADVHFEDARFEFGDEWQRVKDSTPFKQLPVLTVDGTFQIPQSFAIIRYLARKFGFAGATPEEEAWVDAIADQYKDFGEVFRRMIFANHDGKTSEEVERIRREDVIPARDAWFAILNGLLEKSTSGWLVGDGLTWADLVVVNNVTSLKNLWLFMPSDHPKIEALWKRVQEHPKLKLWHSLRPETQL